MFQGAAALNLDAKGRMSIPARHRDALSSPANGAVVITAHLDRCLLLYPLPAWEPIRDRVLAAPSFEPKAALIKRRLIGHACDEVLDAAGRLLIPPELRRLVGLDKAIWLVGMGSHFEVWSESEWMRQQEAVVELGSDALPPVLADLAL